MSSQDTLILLGAGAGLLGFLLALVPAWRQAYDPAIKANCSQCQKETEAKV